MPLRQETAWSGGLASPPQLDPKKQQKSPAGTKEDEVHRNPIEWQPHLIFIVTADTMLKPNV